MLAAINTSMKKVAFISILINQITIAQGQLNYDHAMSSSLVPSNWNSQLINALKWALVKTVTYDAGKTKTYTDGNFSNLFYKFFYTSFYTFLNLQDTTKYEIHYFPAENTFYFCSSSNSKFQNIAYYPYRLRYLDSDYLILEPIDLMHFDFGTGKILNEQEYQKKINDIENSRANKPKWKIMIKGKPVPKVYWVFKK